MGATPTFPTKWHSGEDPTSEPKIQTWACSPTTTILRQSILTHWEAPFLYLIEGHDRALLLDTGTGDVDIREAIDALLINKDLVVAHTHSHADHVGGDRFFQGRPRTSVVEHSIDAVHQFFEISKHQGQQGHIDLGNNRILDVLYTPGHQAAHLTFYDRQTQLLFTGDSLYPGRLTVDDWPAYQQSITRLTSFIRNNDHTISHILGGHIEMQQDGTELPHEIPIHKNEHRLELAADDLFDLHATVTTMGVQPNARQLRKNFVVIPGTSTSAFFHPRAPAPPR